MQKQEILLIVYFTATLILVITIMVIFFVAFNRRKNKMITARIEAKQNFEKELTKSQIEIKENTLKNIAWELHDNIGQLLSVANIQLTMLATKLPKEHHVELDETKQIVLETLQEIRALSKTLNHDVILQNGLIGSIRNEMHRFERMQFLETSMTVEGDEVSLQSDQEILVFRILQEFFSNVIKHAKATNLFVHLCYKVAALEIEVRDDGVGFDTDQSQTNSGLTTMRSRAELLQAEFSIISKPGEGTSLFLNCPYSYESQ